MKHTFSVCHSCGAVNRIDAIKALDQAAHCGQCKATIELHQGIAEVDLDQLDKLVRAADIPIVVDLWASWCGPCLAFAPVYTKLAREKAGEWVFLKINTEKHPEASSVLGVRGIPTIIAFKGGDEIKRQAGAMPEAMFRDWLHIS